MSGSATAPKQQTDSSMDSAAQRFAAMEPSQIAAATADAAGWQPKDGDELQGVVVAIKSGASDFKEKAGRNPIYPIVFVLPEDSDTLVAVHCFQTVLENEMKSQRPMPGESIYIKRIGEALNAKKGQNPTIRYAVYVQREAGSADPWEHMN